VVLRSRLYFWGVSSMEGQLQARHIAEREIPHVSRRQEVLHRRHHAFERLREHGADRDLIDFFCSAFSRLTSPSASHAAVKIVVASPSTPSIRPRHAQELASSPDAQTRAATTTTLPR
jgi:hypothetical protein